MNICPFNNLNTNETGFISSLRSTFGLGKLICKPGVNHLLDSIDFQLLVALFGNARQSYQLLGRRLSLSAPAVRNRLRQLKMNGVRQGYMLTINPSVFDRVGVVLAFPGDFKLKSAQAAVAAPDVSWVRLKLDGQIFVGLWTCDEEKSINYMTKILGVGPSGRALTPRMRHAPVSITDLSIMDSLVDNPIMPFDELVKSTELSPKTIRKHLNTLLETKTISIEPILGSLTDSGELIYPMVIAGNVSMDEVRRIMEEAEQLHYAVDPPVKHVLCRASSLPEVMSKTRMLENIQGVKFVTLSLDREMLVSTELRHSLIQEEIRKLEKVMVA
jgi:DNA-binding Lrp family transcriptional regulator